ncbi:MULTISPECIES: hypothetical protein [Streptomyces]|uniref:hypothetical protein n=1 Tax=Streptomyces TaxID=1883 RepID=UPI000A3915E1|nr:MULTISPECIES: hypothetical protein [Streptomyces]MBP5866087.1 hypothetical protein [Streptomyces sp. LBUM 1484]MBP5880775.1 hypothetical protein [Streptomyces sp. LBUM 1477]MDX2567510.1 hypothetical protein [Streptomyces scabiei]
MTVTTNPNLSRIRTQTLVTAWIFTGLVLAGFAWLLGLQTSWWQRVILALPVVLLAVLDVRGVDALVDVRVNLTRALTDLDWLQVPLAVAGVAWLIGLTPGVSTRITLVLVIALVVALFRIAPSAPAPTGGSR